MANENAIQQVQPAGKPAPVSITTLLSSDKIKRRFDEILGKKAPGFISSVLSVAKSPAIIGSDPNSILSAAVVAATLDLPINPNLGFAYIVSYNDKNLGKQAQFQIGYKGLIQLAQRSGQYKTINATDIREGEIVSENLITGEIEFKKLPAGQREKAKVIGYAAYFAMLNGFYKTLYMTNEELEKHGKSYSQTFRKGFGLWATNFDAMARKTVLKRLLSTYGPLSIETQMVKTFDQATVSMDENLNVDEAEVIYVDNMEEQPEQQTPAEANTARAAAVEAAAAQFSTEGKKSEQTKEEEPKAPF